MLGGAEVEHGASEPVAGHHPRTEPAGAQEKKLSMRLSAKIGTVRRATAGERRTNAWG